MVLDRRALLRIGQNHGHPRFDEGYLLHAGLSAAFATSDERAVVPLRSFGVDPLQDGGDLRVLGYAPFGERELRERLGPSAGALVRMVEARPVPTIEAGTRATFLVRACPTVRTKQPGDRELARDRKGRPRSREMDAYVHATLGLPADALARGLTLPTREAVYGKWLGDQLGDAATLVPVAAKNELVTIRELRRERIYRERGARASERPNVVLEGTLVVSDAERFRALLHRGVGRHRSFGFGMVLLRRAS